MFAAKPQRLVFALSIAVVLAADADAFGQTVRRPMRRYASTVGEPIISPYLNLVRPGTDPGFNYFTLVQPQMQQQRNAEMNASQLQGVNQDLQQAKTGAYGPTGGLRPTGRGASYRNYSHFYPAMGGQGGGGRAGGARRTYPSAASAGGGMFGGMGGGF